MSRTVRSLAVEAGVAVRECSRLLRDAGLKAAVGDRRLEGPDLAAAMRALGLPRRPAAAAAPTGRVLSEDEMVVRLLRPLREKGKVGPQHTTEFENVWAHGVPDHLKGRARDLAEALIAQGCLDEKVSQSRRHVWLTNDGMARLSRAEEKEVAGVEA